MSTDRIWLLGFMMIIAAVKLSAQADSSFAQKSGTDASVVYTIVEKMPVFKGGQTALVQFLQQNIYYPEAAKHQHISGTVYIAFVVTKTGAVENIKVLKGSGFGMDEEAIRVIKLTDGKWDAGMQNNESVSVNFTMPIKFAIEEPPKKVLENTPLYMMPVSQVMNYAMHVEEDTLIDFLPAYYNYIIPFDHRLHFKADSLVLINKNNEVVYGWLVPVFSGGIDSLDKYIYEHLKYPKEALLEKKEGVVDVYFGIDKYGEIGKVNIGDFYGYGCGAEATRLFKNMPTWKPGYESGKAVDFSFHWKIKFKLIDGKPMTYEQFLQQQKIEKAATIYNLGLVQLKSNKTVYAISSFTKVIILTPLDYDAYYSRGIGKAILTDIDGACKDWNKALELGGRDKYQYAAKNCK